MATPNNPTTQPFTAEELRAARAVAYQEELQNIRLGSRRSKSPVQRFVLAELEQRVRQDWKELEAAGMIEPMPEGMVA